MNTRKRKTNIILTILLCIFLILLFIFLYDWVRFQKLVNIYANKIYIGMQENEVINLMGKPKPDDILSITNLKEKEDIEAKIGKKIQKLILYLYEARLSFRKSLLIYFDENNKVVFKNRSNMVTFIE